METNAEISDDVLIQQTFSESDFRQLVHDSMKPTYRSHDAHNEIHLPVLNQTPALSFTTVLIGDSMIERLQTTGSSTRIAQLPSSFNAGVGGDRIENVLYRLDLGLFTSLKNRGIKLWVLMIGTNHIAQKKGLKKKELDAYKVLVQALLRIAPQSRILACGLFQRRDVDDGNMERANLTLKEVVGEINKQLGGEKVFWVDAPGGVKGHLVDHVHLNEEGYRIWDEVLYPTIMGLSS
ncbi:hypothetical protein ONS95_002148 [Cadophora gregata]|uniref:uncharacterized protein n=1 Tax=Cadophora gregata TaxID=51156 RepID=UPI0026DB260D|nr:uncharacterized protein ONS95_002148 [Cadophora gregata]KAK0109455.1 hypothetical protein ONS95_002148 [Cadophora gregata]KAK0110916.1 hypothetical protein ONS96_002502 [Cadophora gregata f. sp. sojae]